MGIFHEINHPAIKGSMHLGMCMGCHQAEMDQLKKDIDAERKKAFPCRAVKGVKSSGGDAVSYTCHQRMNENIGYTQRL